jgi:hypothetical protein
VRRGMGRRRRRKRPRSRVSDWIVFLVMIDALLYDMITRYNRLMDHYKNERLKMNC